MDIKNIISSLPYKDVLQFYSTTLDKVRETEKYWPTIAYLASIDRFFLLTFLLHRKDALHPWLYERCREVEKEPDNYLDLWARFHYKSTIITFAGIIQEIINDPDITIGIYSYNKTVASDFMLQLKREMEINEDLKKAYPSIFFDNPQRDSSLWSIEKGLIVNRKSNPKEPTISAWGLVDSQPIGKHFSLRVYDDIITKDSVTTSDQISKVTEAWELSLSTGDGREDRQWYVGTRYHADDTYQTIIDREYVRTRIFPATDDGTADGNPVFMTLDSWERLKKGTSDFVLACQQLLNPIAGSLQEFKKEWIRRWEVRPLHLNVYIICDPASSKKGSACNTAIPVIGIDAHYNKYLLDGMCHRMDLGERWKNLKHLRNKWIKAPGIQSVQVGYEKYGMQSDIEHFETMMKIEGSSFPIQEVSWTRDGTKAKDDRIRRLIPDHKNWAFFYPEVDSITKRMREQIQNKTEYLIAKPIKRINHENKVYELTDWLIRNEYLRFPSSSYKDFMDAMSRIYDMDMSVPQDLNNHILSLEEGSYIGPAYYKGTCLEPEVQ